ncbi:MFS transporter [Paenarthrobacter nicotinovorans]|uniref:MFS transporter n=1 Tax=Paenarthrobacter nicotinovorans TaxID=29320 RepID=UPI00374A93D1
MTTAELTQAEATQERLPGTSRIYAPGGRFRLYKLTYVLAAAGIATVWGGISGILLPFQIQGLEFANVFGQNSGVDLQQLTTLKAAIAAGTATATTEQQQQLGLLSQYEAARAASLGIVTAVSIAVSMFVGPVAGALSDRTRTRWGRRTPFIVAGAVLGAALLVATRYSPTVAALLLLFTMAQVALGLAPGALNATVPDRVPAHKIGGMSGIAGFGTLLGMTLGTVIGGFMFASLGMDAYFPFVLVAIVLPLLFVTISRDRSSTDLVVPPFSWKRFLLSFTVAVRDRDFRWLLIAKLVMYFGYSISTAFGIYMLQSYIQPALSAEEAARTVPLLTLAGLPGMVVALLAAGWWSDRIGKRKPIVIGASLLFAASLTVPFVSPTLPALFCQAVLGSLAMGAFLTVDQAYFIDLLPDRTAAARDLGVSAFGQNIGQAAGPAVAGIIVATSGSYQIVWVVAFAAVLIAAAAVIPIRRAP